MDLAVGKRISLGPHKGTIRYRGPVPPSNGEWLGIEWDDPTRGKHDGTSADGTRYFHVRIPGSGSFIRPTSSKLSSGCCFLVALRNKYLPSTAEQTASIEQSGTAQQYSRKNLADIEIETPNLDRIALKAARLDRLKEVGLGGWQQSSLPDVDAEAVHDARYDVARAFDVAAGFGPGSIRATCPNIRWLDLSRSLLPDWDEISLIASELGQLKTLLLHFNRLQPPPSPLPTSWTERMAHIQDLRLDGTLMQWSDVVKLAPALTGLRSLHVGSNEITSLAATDLGPNDGGAVIFPSLTSLSLEDSPLESWPDLVTALSRLPSLETLNLDRNRISAIPPAPTSTHQLPRLKQLHLRGNPIEAWSSLEHIQQWLGPDTKLETLNISTLHLDEDASISEQKTATRDLLSQYEYRDFRAIAIARLRTLTVLDKTEITPKERRDAELFVYTRFREGDAYIVQGGVERQGGEDRLQLSNADKAARFPRFLELARLFDGDDAVAPASQQTSVSEKKPNTLRSKMLSITVIACATAPLPGPPHVAHAIAEREDVKVLATTPLRLLRIKLASGVGVTAGQVEQVWVLMRQTEGDERIVLELDMSRTLDWYEVAAGDTVVLVVGS
ncbi:related to PAC2-microtubule effector required for tubulin heterodimer formation [Sporisorium reilianum f. sp. reilianum]|uniref:Related to PAC2-microtubule effector required for tubulin heterodimer formation n=1 Tax=Sporisorium reilianum f. sp. reilianum TaxID=72559 RepID=A0A2N8U9U2_9BASI|nr:related to PAC2-microtubule effector required for tubulin heterodimer formation [Sporisorium reilianum f. sp. reilianum]